jgi:hypothetical protein
MSRPRVDDYFPWGCGDKVREKDGRHVGRVEAVIFNTVRVLWEDTGWRSDCAADDLEPAALVTPFTCGDVP